MKKELEKLAWEWVKTTPETVDIESDFYCKTRDVFEARNAKIPEMLIKKDTTKKLFFRHDIC